MGQLVADMEKGGLLERVPDPTDGRAKIIRLT
jgi:DNA-binding MarR family transcriptional regulator